jgi:hypothetical protein
MTEKVIPGTSAGGLGRASSEVFLESNKGVPVLWLVKAPPGEAHARRAARFPSLESYCCI